MDHHIPESPRIRLACIDCDREDYDGATLQQAVDDGWQEIEEAEINYDSSWWNHLGYCSKCSDIVDLEREDASSERL